MGLEHLLIETVSVKRVCSVMEEFFDEYLRGALIFDNSLSEDGFAQISPESLATFYKRLAAMLFGETTIKLRAYSENLYCKLVAEWAPCDKIGERERAELAQIAKQGGFEIVFKDGEYTEKLAVLIELRPQKFLSMYAHTQNSVRDAFYRVFVLYELLNKKDRE